ncbi:MAG: ABC transporter ATP-binding protein [Oscillospiraceae bacterium]|nr:ABC transporter ATP-binding protein [Oscillospiraceae bacterium]
MKVFDSIKKQFYNEDPKQLKYELSWLWKRVKQYKIMVFMVGLLGLAGTVMSLASSVTSKYLIDAVTALDGDKLLIAAVVMAVMLLGSIALQAVSSRTGATVHVKVKNQMQQKTYGCILHAKWESLEGFRNGDLISRLNSDINAVSDSIIGFIPNFVTASVKFAGAFGIMLFYDPVMALIALLGAPVTMVMSKILMRKLRDHNRHMKELSGEIMSFQEDSFRNLTSIKAFSVTGYYEDEMGRLHGTYENAYLSFNSFQIKISTVMSLVGVVVTTACFGWGIYRLWTGHITYGSLTLFLQLASTLRGAFSSLVSMAQQAISITTSAGRIIAVEDLAKEDASVPEGFKDEAELSVLLENVSFRYQSGETVLETFDFAAYPGDQIAITGPSGEGKTTLLRILLGLVDPVEGKAELAGKNRYTVSAGTRGAFAYVPQGNSIFTGTVAQNLRIVKPDASDEEIEAALKTACAWEFVSSFADGTEHMLGAGGRGISEGQAQRIAIARALLRKAPILLLDEATSGLDIETEKKLMSNLKESGMVHTCILVTHRPESTRYCNRAYEVQGGSVREVHHGA